MTPRYYIERQDGTPELVDRAAHEHFMAHSVTTFVREVVGAYTVITRFLGVDVFGAATPYVYETYVFGPPAEHTYLTSPTRQAALQTHAQQVARVTQGSAGSVDAQLWPCWARVVAAWDARQEEEWR